MNDATTIIDLTQDAVWRKALNLIIGQTLAEISSIAWAGKEGRQSADMSLVEQLAQMARNLPLFLAAVDGALSTPARFNMERLREDILRIGDHTPRRKDIRDVLLSLMPDTAHKKAAILRR